MKILKLLFSRLVLVGIVLVIQVGWFVFFLFELGNYSIGINIAFTVISILVVLYLVNKRDNPAYKLAWVILILSFPLLGGLLYILSGNKKPAKYLSLRLEHQYKVTKSLLNQNPVVIKEMEDLDKNIANQAKYISYTAGFPIYKNTETKYYKSGEENFIALKEELRKAKHYIFMEYFIIADGIMWNEVLGILEQKAKDGLDVRLIYDDVGCLTLLPYHYYKKLEAKGIKSFAFNPFIPIFSVAMNHRDHRKITVIDGHTAFTGGINLADEYINEIDRFGYWKDAGIMLKGDAAWNFTVMFLQTWNAIRPTDSGYDVFKPHIHSTEKFEIDGYVQPYGDTPLDDEIVGESVYLNVINTAKEYIYIYTPYLIIDNELITALTLSAKRGVDVRIITPAIPDKKYVFWGTQSYYQQLIESGVRIYEYTPGFIHAKCVVCDDEVATVGSINMDFRSLYLHFECGVWLYKSKAVMQLKADAIETLKESKEIHLRDCKRKLPMRILQAIIRLFAPLM